MTGTRWGAGRGGFSLLELVIALVIFQVGLLGVAAMALMGQESMRRARLIMRGTVEATRVGDSILAAGGDARGQTFRPWGSLAWEETGDGAVRITALAENDQDTLAVLLLWPRLEIPESRIDPVSGQGGGSL